MDTDFLKNKWNLLYTGAEALLVPIFGFVDIPYYAASALASTANYELFARFILAIIIALMLVPCSMFNKKNNRNVWFILTIILLSASLLLYFKNISFKKNHTIDYTTYNGGYIVKGIYLFPEKDTLLKQMEKEKGSTISETELFAEEHEDIDSTGVLTAAKLWPKNQIENNAKKILLLYLATILSFSLTAICAVQTVFCTGAKE